MCIWGQVPILLQAILSTNTKQYTTTTTTTTTTNSTVYDDSICTITEKQIEQKNLFMFNFRWCTIDIYIYIYISYIFIFLIPSKPKTKYLQQQVLLGPTSQPSTCQVVHQPPIEPSTCNDWTQVLLALLVTCNPKYLLIGGSD